MTKASVEGRVSGVQLIRVQVSIARPAPLTLDPDTRHLRTLNPGAELLTVLDQSPIDSFAAFR